MYRKILAAFDGSPSGRSGLLECATIQQLLVGSELHLLAVAPIAAGIYLTEGFVPDTLQDEQNRAYREVLDEGLALLTGRGVSAEGHLVTGEPIDEICRLARELDVDLIVVGHGHRASRLERWWRGSVGASLVEDAPCSVLVAIAKQPAAP
ncbi:MAG: universal stress protein [Sterolibacteriaceae bacterium]|uniref:Universal stress protein n=1 Tax=Candidatus Methylophosphatis roskildensis TaxID=2899263 RepID=A0A9D7E808_9PROT|nr:universal stress protein [Candidatus Methylophosphatis roskildensis]MBK6974826.1 universal stress protein [Candidatus Methylophosphatis roskildensis]MBK6975664.1 universal stress protein [Candidatus Methylophosphatis roskildensis]